MTKRRATTHRKSHGWVTGALAVACCIAIFSFPAASLAITLVFVLSVILSSGVIHQKAGTLNRDIMIEYVLIGVVLLVVVAGSTVSFGQ